MVLLADLSMITRFTQNQSIRSASEYVSDDSVIINDVSIFARSKVITFQTVLNFFEAPFYKPFQD